MPTGLVGNVSMRSNRRGYYIFVVFAESMTELYGENKWVNRIRPLDFALESGILSALKVDHRIYKSSYSGSLFFDN